jgi:hypothetical protein
MAASGRFFYQADSGLYRAIRDTFFTMLPSLRSSEFLKSFRGLGCYLVDLCEMPVNRLAKDQRRRACADGEARLARTLKQYKPKILISVVCSIALNVRRSQQRANWSGTHLQLPYPGRWWRHRIAFERALTRILNANESRKRFSSYPI